MSSAAHWLAAWPGGVLIGVANGAAREATVGRRLPERTAHNVSTASAMAAFAAYYSALDRRWPLPNRGEALVVGAGWLAMTVAFEFGFGRVIAQKPWSELLADYNLARGRTWPLLLAWLTVGPEVTRRARRRGNR
jgi:hypothetical protein